MALKAPAPVLPLWLVSTAEQAAGGAAAVELRSRAAVVAEVALAAAPRVVLRYLKYSDWFRLVQ